MYIKTANGWKPLWTMSEPARPEIPWGILGKGWTADAVDAQLADRRRFEDSQHKLLLSMRP